MILAGNNTTIAAAQRATSTIPIVMVLGIDPVRNGFIDSFARPGRNITGLTNDPGQSMHGKMLAMLKELVPAASVIGVLVQQGLGYDRGAVDEAARLLKLQLHYAPEVRQPQDIEPAFEAMKRAGAQASYVIGGGLIYNHRQAVTELELRYRLPGAHFGGGAAGAVRDCDQSENRQGAGADDSARRAAAGRRSYRMTTDPCGTLHKWRSLLLRGLYVKLGLRRDRRCCYSRTTREPSDGDAQDRPGTELPV